MNCTRRNCSTKIAVVFPVIIIVLMLTASLAWAQAGSRVFAQPVDSPDGTLVVDVIAENVTDLYGAEFRLTYDPAVVSVQDSKPEQEGIQIEVGTLLPPDKGFVVANQVDEAAGTITFAMTLLNPAPPVTGGGPLARVTFNVLQQAPFSINVEHAKLVAVNLQTIPSQTELLAIGGAGQQTTTLPNAPGNETAAAPVDLNPASDPAGASQPGSETSVAAAPVEASPALTVEEKGFPWWIVAAVIMVLGILAVGGFIVMDGLKSASGAQTNQQNSSVDKQTRYSAGTRPSTFKNQ